MDIQNQIKRTLSQPECLAYVSEPWKPKSKGWFQLPAPQIVKGGPSPRRLLEPVAEPQGVPAEVGAVVGLELVRVEQEDQMRIWNELDPGTSAGSRSAGGPSDPLSGALSPWLAGRAGVCHAGT
jgi:hypothetical protein